MKIHSHLFCAIGLALGGLSLAAQATPNCFVNAAAPSGAGKSWEDSYADLQSALADASCTEIWVAKGVYKPTATTDRTISFNIRAGTVLYGSFKGYENSLDSRVIPGNATVLSGDIDSNDVNVSGTQIDETTADIRGENSYHVVRMDGSSGSRITRATKLDGFIVTGGMTDARLYPDYLGGGLLCNGRGAGNECSPELNNMEFRGNKSRWGGAIYNDGTDGGTSAPLITHSLFEGNDGTPTGGAIANSCSSPIIIDTSFINNGSNIGEGGAVENDGFDCDSSPVFTRVLFFKNHATNGGAFYNYGFGTGTASPVFTNVTFSENRADDVGGAIDSAGSSGGIANPKFVNVTFYRNSAAYFGGAISTGGTSGLSNPLLLNVILWNDIVSDPFESFVGPEIYNNAESSTVTIGSSVIEGGCPAGAVCANLLSGDPMLGALADNGGFSRTLMPGLTSLALNQGNNAFCPLDDQRGTYRFDSLCDIGAVERQPVEDHIFQDGFDKL